MKYTAFVSNLSLVYENGQWPMKSLNHMDRTWVYLKTVSCKVTGNVNSHHYTSGPDTLVLLNY